MAKNKIHTLQDVRDWRMLKKDELELEKLKLRAEQNEMKKAVGRGLGKILFYEGVIIVGEKLLMTVLKSIFKSSEKDKKEDTTDKEEKET